MPTPEILATVRRYWGFDTLRPLQAEAITAGIARRDAVVVLPTGGGNSLCYQVPPAVTDRTDVVVSPLIALMKDQVDGLRACGYPAAALHSNMDRAELREVESGLSEDRYRLVFVAPERLLAPRFFDWLARARVRDFAVDEAHCISHWGHDFRPEYRQLAELRTRVPDASLRAYTATATERVRADIVSQLALRDPLVLVGSFDRPNLTYRVVPKVDAERQVLEVLARHAGQAAIVYCLSRRETEELAEWLVAHGVRAAHYHAGMAADPRRRTQDEFAEERLDVVVATVAFGMGIDRSDVRCVVHACLPKSVEHYQQETGRAGRDGLEAERAAVLAGGRHPARAPDGTLRQRRGGAARDRRGAAGEWRERSGGGARGGPPAAAPHAAARRRRPVPAPRCRSISVRATSAPGCGACDVCLGEIQGIADGTVVAQKILSCVARAGEGFGVMHIVDVLVGGDTERVRQRRHDQLSTYGLLKSQSRKAVTSYVHQLLDQHLLDRTPGDRPVLKLNPASWAVMRGQRDVQLMQPKEGPVAKTRFDAESWEGVDRGLFDHLRQLRRSLADTRGVPPYVIFSDATLRDLARLRPSSRPAFAAVRGVGEEKLDDLGPIFIEHIRQYCAEHGLSAEQN